MKPSHILVFFLLVGVSLTAFSQAFLRTPVWGQYGEDYLLVNYVDWKFQGYQDAYCGTKSYDGHQGTDYVIRSFSQMDSGVNVLAADSGVVTFIQEGLFDREKVSDTAKGLGNYIAIKHPNNYYSYYGHLKRNSSTVQVGDTVSAGQKIAEIGSSGNSSDPHLHFELWFDSLYVVDPFKGDCGNDSSLWLDTLAYDSSFNSWEQGLYLKNVDIDVLREREPSTLSRPYQVEDKADTLSFWTHLYGVRAGDTLTIQWNDSSGTTHFSADFSIDRDYWYYYFWSYITTDILFLGEWEVIVLRNGGKVLQEGFEVIQPLTTGGINKKIQKQTCDHCKSLPAIKIYPNPSHDIIFIEQVDISSQNIRLFDLFGKEVTTSIAWLRLKDYSLQLDVSELPNGLYFLKVETKSYKIYKI